MDYPCKHCDEKEEESVKNHNIKQCSKSCNRFRDWVRCERAILYAFSYENGNSVEKE